MAQIVISNSPEMARAIKQRRTELGLTIEEAASKAGVGTKTWSRYEAGEAIRKDKSKGIFKALNWVAFPNQEEGRNQFHLEEYEKDEAYSSFLAEMFGPLAAVSFVIGSEILLDYLKEDMEELSSMPKGSHVGQLSGSFLNFELPPQFLMHYDYEFLYLLRARVNHFRMLAHTGERMIAHSVLDELTLYLIMEESRFLMESMDFDESDDLQDDYEGWDDWPFEIFDDSDLELFLYSDTYLVSTDTYHFSNWSKEQFYLES